MKKFDYLVVGSGLYGAIFAHEAKAHGKSVLVVDKRPNIAGNIYTENVEGINVHKYGAHIFHTNNKNVWNYITQFAEFNRFTNSPVANYKGELYSLPFNMYTFNKMWGVVTPEEAASKIEEQRKEITGEPQNLEEQAISLVGRDIYEKLIKGYTEKQWGRDCKELPSFIIKRLPVRLTFDNNYFNLVPVFCDVNDKDYTMDVTKIESLITDRTVAIVPVHVYGNICDVEEIDRIAKKYGLKVIYDAAHAFAVKYKGVSTACFGDASMFSFHATKVFNTIEGGAVCFKDDSWVQLLNDQKNFGIHGPESVCFVGGNAKMNEFQAAMGICNLRHPRYASSRGIREKFRQDAAGAEKAFGFAHRGTDKQLLVFEASIDLLSFIELFPKNWQQHNYLSLGGVSGKALRQFLSERPDVERVWCRIRPCYHAWQRWQGER